VKVSATLILLLIFSLLASAECNQDDFTDFSQVKDAVRHFTKGKVYTGWDEKSLNRAGDLAALAVLRTLSDAELDNPQTARQVLGVIRASFECPSRCIASCSNREPRVTMLLLDYLQNHAQGLSKEIDETRTFIVQQLRPAQ
jgi:hypothetical protein